MATVSGPGTITEAVMYTQLQPWSSVGVLPCMEQVSGPSIPTRVGEYYRTPRSHPWRPTLGYETVQVHPLPSQPITNQFVDPCYTPEGMVTPPLKFPNLVHGFERNPAHAARAALYTRYTPYEWSQNQLRFYNEADSNRRYAEKLRHDTNRLMCEADECVTEGQRDAGRKLGARITDIDFWIRELGAELERLVMENKKMQECQRTLHRAIQDLEGPLHIAQECLYHREFRKGSELVHDQTEQSLLREVEIIRRCIKKLEDFIDRCTNQLSEGRAAQNELEMDISNKETAQGIDTVCHQLNNYSRGLQYYGGIEKYDPCVTNAESWAQASDDVLTKCRKCRERSCQLRSDIETAINAVAREIWDAWCETNDALARRSAELLEAKSKLQAHLHRVQQDTFHIEKTMDLLTKAVADKSAALKVAHTRLEARTHRPQAELCRDYAQLRMVNEVDVIKAMIHELHAKLQQCEAQHQQLLRTRGNLETDLKEKVDALFIDREKCIGMRRSYPISATIKY